MNSGPSKWEDTPPQPSSDEERSLNSKPEIGCENRLGVMFVSVDSEEGLGSCDNESRENFKRLEVELKKMTDNHLKLKAILNFLDEYFFPSYPIEVKIEKSFEGNETPYGEIGGVPACHHFNRGDNDELTDHHYQIDKEVVNKKDENGEPEYDEFDLFSIAIHEVRHRLQHQGDQSRQEEELIMFSPRKIKDFEEKLKEKLSEGGDSELRRRIREEMDREEFMNERQRKTKELTPND